jgi:DNA-binding Xre family transcriptional regulator
MIQKYFWDLNKQALRETEGILQNVSHPKFLTRMVAFLSRCDKPRELFSIISKEKFIEVWPKIRSYWLKTSRNSDFRDWWETIYEQLLENFQHKYKRTLGKNPLFFQRFGQLIKQARISKDLSQKQLASNIGMKQPDISRIEEGKKNITLYTLMRLCKILDIKKIDIS